MNPKEPTPNNKTPLSIFKVEVNLWLLGILGIFLILSFFYLTRNPELDTQAIHVVIDRPPLKKPTASSSQPLDIMARRIAPLLEHYEWSPQSSQERIRLEPKSNGLSPIEFHVIKDETTRAMKFLRGDADVLYNTLSLVKTQWIIDQLKRPRVFSASGLNLSYLGFNLRNPILKNIEVRRAIAHAFPVNQWGKAKYLGWVTPFPLTPPHEFNPLLAQRELDRLGYPVLENGNRFSLQYLCTSAREGLDLAMLTQEALKKIQIKVTITALDPLLYFQKIKKQEADLFSVRWFRMDRNESFAPYLMTNGERNYFGFSNPDWDKRLSQNPSISDAEFRDLVFREFPFFPLFTWNHGLILSDRVKIADPHTLSSSFDETFRFLLQLRL